MIANRRNERRSRLFSSSFSSSSLTSSSYSYCALSFSRVFWSNFVSKRRQTPKWKSAREFLYVQLLYSITSFWMCDDDCDDYDVCKVPSSYRQPGGRGQLLSRRYCTHSKCFFSCAQRTAYSSQGALAVSRKYFKQSKWPYSAAFEHAHSIYLSNLRSTRYSSI